MQFQTYLQQFSKGEVASDFTINIKNKCFIISTQTLQVNSTERRLAFTPLWLKEVSGRGESLEVNPSEWEQNVCQRRCLSFVEKDWFI